MPSPLEKNGSRLIVANSVVPIAKPPSASAKWTRPADGVARRGASSVMGAPPGDGAMQQGGYVGRRAVRSSRGEAVDRPCRIKGAVRQDRTQLGRLIPEPSSTSR